MVQKAQFEKQIFEPGVQPMEFICMDLIGEFHPPSCKGNRYALTAVCMLTGYTFCIPIKNRSAEEIGLFGEIILLFLLVIAGNSSWIVVLNSKMIYFLGL